MSLLVEEEVAVAPDAAVSKDKAAAAVTAADQEEAANFITRQVLERGTSFFDG